MQLACPRCRTLLNDIDSATRRCVNDGLTFQRVDGIWRMLLAERQEIFSRFIHDYEAVRRFEKRGATEASYYRALPYHQSRDWQIRAKSFDALMKHVLVPAEKRSAHLGILDLGAGNGWLSNQLALRGYDVAAVDLTVNEFDGLGCFRFYESTFMPVQAEFDRLPFSDGASDLVMFNASLHYSLHFNTTLTEALRVLNHAGSLVILDSPIYHDARSGKQMVSEREAQFARQYGFASNQLQSENYLTYTRLEELARELELRWEIITPFFNLQWTLRPIQAFLLRRREPAKFHVIVGKRTKHISR
jgi:SAM-dependent methyltransferase